MKWFHRQKFSRLVSLHLMSKYYSKLYPQSTFRKPLETSPQGDQFSELDIEFPNLNFITPPDIATLKTKILAQIQSICAHLLPSEGFESKPDKFSKVIYKKLQFSSQSKSKSTYSLDTIWDEIQSKIINKTKYLLLQYHSQDILDHFAQKINFITLKYTRYLPSHVASSEKDDLKTISQLEFLETVKSWDPNKSDNIWSLAYTRVTGAMKDHIRYISKADPSRFYDWVVDAGYLLVSYNNHSEFETKIETSLQLTQAMDSLTQREQYIVTSYAKKDMTFQQISKELNISESQISRIYKSALEKIKKNIHKKPN